MKPNSKQSSHTNGFALNFSKSQSFNHGNLPISKQIKQHEGVSDTGPMKSNRGKQSSLTQQLTQQQSQKLLENQIPRANLDLSTSQYQHQSQQFYGELNVACSNQSLGSQISNGSQQSSLSQVSSSVLCSSKSRSSSQKAIRNLDNGLGLGGLQSSTSVNGGEQLFLQICNQAGHQQNSNSLASPPTITGIASRNNSNNFNNNITSMDQIPSQPILPQEQLMYRVATTPTSPSAKGENGSAQLLRSFTYQQDNYNQQLSLDMLHKAILISNYKEATRIVQSSNFTFDDINTYRDKISNNLIVHSLAMRSDSLIFLKFLECYLPGIDLNLFSSQGWTPLMLACMKGNYEISRYIASNKSVDVNAQDLSGNSALHIACMYGNKKIVEMLLGQRLVQSNMKNNEDKTPKDMTQDSKILQLFQKLRKVNLDQTHGCTSITMNLSTNSLVNKEQQFKDSPRTISRSRNTNPKLSLNSSLIQQPTSSIRSYSNSSHTSSHSIQSNGISSTAKLLNKSITKNSFFSLKQSVNQSGSYHSSSHLNSPSINSSFSSNKYSQNNSPNMSQSVTQSKSKYALSSFSTANQSAQLKQNSNANDYILKGLSSNNITQIQDYPNNNCAGDTTPPVQQKFNSTLQANSAGASYSMANISSSQVLLHAKSEFSPPNYQVTTSNFERGSLVAQNQSGDESGFLSQQQLVNNSENRFDMFSNSAVKSVDTSIIAKKINSANSTIIKNSSPLIYTEPIDNGSPIISKGNICSPFKAPHSNSSQKGNNNNNNQNMSISNSISKILDKNSRSRSQNQNSSKHKTPLTTSSQTENKSPLQFMANQTNPEKIAAFTTQAQQNAGNYSTAASSKLCSVDKVYEMSSNFNNSKVSSDSNESNEQSHLINNSALGYPVKMHQSNYPTGKQSVSAKKSQQIYQSPSQTLGLKSSQSQQVFASLDKYQTQTSEFMHPSSLKAIEIPFQKLSQQIITPILLTQQAPQKGMESYRILSHLGSGNYGDVFLVEYIGNSKKYAMKLLNKEKLLSKNMLKYAIAERNVMQKCNSPFIVKMIHSFQTDSHLVIVMEYCPGGDLYSCLLEKKRFDEDLARKYLSEILLAVEELHYHDVIYRDMKPENIVLGSDGHVKLIDFGLSRENIGEGAAQSFCGSAVYLAPEIISKKGHNKSVDWYQFGVLAYELLVGQPPFNSFDRKELYFHIQNKKVEYPSFLSDKAKSLISELLNKNPEERLGSGRADAQQIKDHPFFDQTNWFDVQSKIYSMPIPQITQKTKDTKVDPKIFQTQLKDQLNVPQWYFLNTPELF